MTAPIRVELYSRPGCHLCDEAKEVIEGARAQAPAFELVEIDIDGDASLEARFGEEIPVVFIAGRKAFKYRVDEHELLAKLTRPVAESL